MARASPERADRMSQEPVPKSKLVNRLISAVVGVVVIGASIWGVRARAAQSAAGAQKGPAMGDRVVPVLAAPVEQKDVPIYLEGLGTVAAFATVTVKPQVEGRLDKVFFTEGQSVKKGDLLAQIDPRPFDIQLRQASAAIARDDAQLKAARVNLDRYRDLNKQGLAPSQQVDDQTATVAQLEAVTRGDQAAAANARLSLDYARITSPIDGVTGVRQVDAGNLVHPTDASGLVVITQLDPIAVFFTLPEDDLEPIQAELARGNVAVDAYSRDGERKIATGQLTLVDNQINQATATIKLKSVFANGDKKLWPNQFVRAKLLLTTAKSALVVPAAAVQRGPTSSFVYVIGADNTVAARDVVVDRLQNDIALLKSGLSAGEQVVVDGQSQLKPGGKVAPKPLGGKDDAGKGDGAKGDAAKGDGAKGDGAKKGPRAAASAKAAP